MVLLYLKMEALCSKTLAPIHQTTRRHFPKTVSSQHNSELLLTNNNSKLFSPCQRQVSLQNKFHITRLKTIKKIKLIIRSVKQRLSSLSIVSNCSVQWCSYIFWHPRLVITMATSNTYYKL
jgi:hypothetical protein